MITRLLLSRFGRFKQAQFPLDKITVFLGNNESGKTTLFDALCDCLSSPGGQTRMGRYLNSRYGAERQAELEFRSEPFSIPLDLMESIHAVSSRDDGMSESLASGKRGELGKLLFCDGIDLKSIAEDFQHQSELSPKSRGGKRQKELMNRLLEVQTDVARLKDREARFLREFEGLKNREILLSERAMELKQHQEERERKSSALKLMGDLVLRQEGLKEKLKGISEGLFRLLAEGGLNPEGADVFPDFMSSSELLDLMTENAPFRKIRWASLPVLIFFLVAAILAGGVGFLPAWVLIPAVLGMGASVFFYFYSDRQYKIKEGVLRSISVQIEQLLRERHSTREEQHGVSALVGDMYNEHGSRETLSESLVKMEDTLKRIQEKQETDLKDLAGKNGFQEARLERIMDERRHADALAEELESELDMLNHNAAVADYAGKLVGQVHDQTDQMITRLETDAEDLLNGMTGYPVDLSLSNSDFANARQLDRYGSGLEPLQLSKGRQDLYYFSLRLALFRRVSKEAPVLILDDCFSSLDDAALERTLRILEIFIKKDKIQLILFTRQKQVAKYFHKIPGFLVHSLSN